MGMNTYVVAIRAPDEVWRKNKAVWDACMEAGVPVPDKVDDYFGGEPPDPNGVVVKLGEDVIQKYTEDMRDGYDVILKNLPNDVTYIRFFNSY